MSQSFSQYNFFIYTYKDFVLLNRMNLGMRLVCVCVVGGRWWVRVSAVAPVLLDQGIIFAEQISSIIEVYLTRIIELLKHVEPFDIFSLKTMIFDHNIVYSHVIFVTIKLSLMLVLNPIGITSFIKPNNNNTNTTNNNNNGYILLIVFFDYTPESSSDYNVPSLYTLVDISERRRLWLTSVTDVPLNKIVQVPEIA